MTTRQEAGRMGGEMSGNNQNSKSQPRTAGAMGSHASTHMSGGSNSKNQQGNRSQSPSTMTTQEAGRLGAEARNKKLSPAERSAASQRAAETRRAANPNAFSEMGQAGAQARHNKSAEEESEIARRAAATRKGNNPEAFIEMGRKGGAQSHGGGRREESE